MIAFNVDQGSLTECDIMRYRAQYITFTGRPFGDLFSANILFDSINWFFANYISPNPRLVGSIWTFISTSIYLIACSIFIFSIFDRKKFFKKKDLFVLLAISCIIIMPIVIVNELLKQTTAISLILLALSLSYSNRKFAWIPTGIALFVHFTSTILFWPLLFWKSRFVRRYWPLMIAISCCLGAIDIIKILNILLSRIPFFQLIGLAEALESYASFNQWGGSKRFYLSFLFFSIQLFYIAKTHAHNKKIYFPMLALIFCIIVSNLSNNHNFARLVNNLYPFNALALIIGVYQTKKSLSKFAIISSTIFILFTSNIIQFYSNIENNYFVTYMGNDPVKILTSNLFDYFDTI